MNKKLIRIERNENLETFTSFNHDNHETYFANSNKVDGGKSSSNNSSNNNEIMNRSIAKRYHQFISLNRLLCSSIKGIHTHISERKRAHMQTLMCYANGQLATTKTKTNKHHTVDQKPKETIEPSKYIDATTKYQPNHVKRNM